MSPLWKHISETFPPSISNAKILFKFQMTRYWIFWIGWIISSFFSLIECVDNVYSLKILHLLRISPLCSVWVKVGNIFFFKVYVYICIFVYLMPLCLVFMASVSLNRVIQPRHQVSSASNDFIYSVYHTVYIIQCIIYTTVALGGKSRMTTHLSFMSGVYIFKSHFKKLA